jgi:small conductance mechanosensitive channel
MHPDSVCLGEASGIRPDNHTSLSYDQIIYFMNYVEEVMRLAISYAPKLLGALLMLIVGFWLARYIAGRLRKALESNDRIDASLVPFLSSLTLVIVKMLVLLSAASMFGLEVTSFVAIFGALAFAIGMALQGNLSHMASGILILFFRPFRVGDFIVTQGYSGTVKEIQIFNTILVTLDNRIIIIPNGSITGDPIENLSANPIRKVPMVFGVGYGVDIDHARSVIQEVAGTCPGIIHDKPVDIFVTELADSSVNFAVRPWCKTEDYWTVYFYMQEYIKKAFDTDNISIPFPQLDVHMPTSN